MRKPLQVVAYLFSMFVTPLEYKQYDWWIAANTKCTG